MRFDRLWRGARLATLNPGQGGLGLIEDGVVACVQGRIAFVGSAAQLPPRWEAREQLDLEGRLVTPGLIDCHTHLVYGGDRADEFEMRLKGISYESIARNGGGILSTVNATRAASEADLIASALPRLDALMREGVTTLEIKSGYGLSVSEECKQLRAVRALGRMRDVTITPTLLAAHALPSEFAGNADQ